MGIHSERFEKENAGYLSQYLYDLSKNESGSYLSNDTDILYYGYRQAIPRIDELQMGISVLQKRLEAAEELLKLSSEKLALYRAKHSGGYVGGAEYQGLQNSIANYFKTKEGAE